MTLSKGDHLVIKRNGQIVDGEAYREYEVLNWPGYYNPEYAKIEGDVHTLVLLRKVE